MIPKVSTDVIHSAADLLSLCGMSLKSFLDILIIFNTSSGFVSYIWNCFVAHETGFGTNETILKMLINRTFEFLSYTRSGLLFE